MVDKYGRAHDERNLFGICGANFVTSGVVVGGCGLKTSRIAYAIAAMFCCAARHEHLEDVPRIAGIPPDNAALPAFVGCVSWLGRRGTILKLVALADVWASTCTARRHFVAHAPGG